MLNADLFNLWFAPISAGGLENGELTLEVANEFCEVWLKDNYLDLIQDVLAHVSGSRTRVVFRVVAPVTARATAALTPPPDLLHEEDLRSASVTPESRVTGPASLSTARDRTRESDRDAAPGFNPNNTFETFVVGTNNNFAHAAALAVAQAPGKSYNPLFLYGGVGLGKTHLLHAIGQHVQQNRRGARVAYLSSEKFTNEYIDAIQNHQVAKFRKKYRQTDVLLIDDIQFLAGKERIQEEFFHTFNALHEAHRQIVLTCDRPASEIQNLEHRLVSRFEWGLVTDVQPPDGETRIAILRRKARSMGVELPDDVLNFLAHRIRTNVRRLEGALIRVASYASLTGRRVGTEIAEGLLREILNEESKNTITVDLIQKKVAEHFDIRLADMTSRRRPENIAFPRQIAMFLARQLTENSLNAIGEAFGGRDHGTVLHACRLVQDRMEVDPSVRQVVHFLEKQLQR